MENLRYPIKLNMENTGGLLTSIRLKQGDSAIIFVLRIFKNGQNVFSVDDIPSIVFNRPDGSAVIGECSVAEGQYTYKILGNELQYPGQIRADVKFDIYTETESSTTFLFECVKDTLPQNIHGAGIYVNSLKDIKDYLDQTVIKLEQELAAFDLQQVLDAVNFVQESADEIEDLMPEIRGVTGDVSNLKETVGDKDISEVAANITSAILNLNENKLENDSDTENNIVTFTSDDADDREATSWIVVDKLTSKIKHKEFFQRVSQMFKNVRYLYKMLGRTDISELGTGDGKGTVTGALDTLNSNFSNYQPKGNYAAANHNHSGVYQPAGSYVKNPTNNSIAMSYENITNTTIPYMVIDGNNINLIRFSGCSGHSALILETELDISTSPWNLKIIFRIDGTNYTKTIPLS